MSITRPRLWFGLACTLLGVILGLSPGLAVSISAATETPTSALPGPASQGSRGTPAGSAQKGIGQIALSFGGEGAAPGTFTDPRTIAIDGAGYIYVADYTTGRIQRFDSAGKFASEWVVEQGQTNGLPLTGLAADPAGNVYVVRGGGVIKYNGSTGEVVFAARPDRRLRSIDSVAILSDGNFLVLVVRADTDDVYRVSSEGRIIGVGAQKIISSISGRAELNLDMSAGEDGNLYILSMTTDTIYVFKSTDLTLMAQINVEKDVQGSTSAVAADGKGQIYLGDFAGIRVYSPDGALLQTIKLTTPGEIARDLAFDGRGTLFTVTSKGMVHRIRVGTETGR